MSFLSVADIFAPGAAGILLYVLGVLVAPAVIGLTLKGWTGLAIVATGWSGLMLIGAAAGWLAATDDVPTQGKLAASALLILLPAEVVAGAAILLRRSIHPVRR
jgi:hypothetical protein